ncbi:MAG: type II toxin-antitoxin system RatA family toxin [Hahellaceae bacterium]|nr:type II toxin-antitoxin system RatA family toxin [Hahellaceae bacterium]
MPHKVDRSALVLHSARDMYGLVNDVRSYPLFLPWCSSAVIHEESYQSDGGIVLATLEVAKGGVRHQFTTRNLLLEPETIRIELIDGPFSTLSGLWSFSELSPEACKIALSLQFDFQGPLAKMAFGPVFSQAANTMVDAFCKRANEIYVK